MHGGDRRLEQIRPDSAARERALDQRHAFSDLVAIPQRAVLLFEEQEAAGAVDAAREAGVMEVHERE